MIKQALSLLTLLVWIASQPLPAQPRTGDSLALLSKRVWVYTDPGDLTTRLGPFSYTGKPFCFLKEDPTWPDYLQIITPAGDTAYTLRKNLSTNPAIDRELLREEIRTQQGDFSPTLIQHLVNHLFDWQKWYTYVWLVGWVVLLLFFWKYFHLLDAALCRLSKQSQSRPLSRWPITWSAIAGLVIGITMLFDATEADWFFSEGIRVFAFYPSFWDYLWWITCLLFFFLLISMITESIRHFGWLFGSIRSLVLFVVMNLYLFTGLLTGWIVAILLVLFLLLRLISLGGSGSSPREIEYNGHRYIRK